MITDKRRTHLGLQEFLQAAAERLQQEWREGHHIKSCSVFFNITNFHLYNTAHGFRQGDICLQHIENILQEHPNAAVLEDVLKKNFPEYLEGDGIKWNFTKFLIDRDGTVVKRFEPTKEPAAIAADIEALL